MNPYNEDVNVVTSEQVPKLTLKMISNADSNVDCFFENYLNFQDALEIPLKNFIDIKKQHIEIRIITEISKDNLNYYKDIARHFNIRHLDGIKGNFMIYNRNEFAGYLFDEQSRHTKLLHITDRSFVDSQQYIFDSLWATAVPLKEKITEIEEPSKSQFTSRIAEAIETRRLMKKIINSATDELLLLFSTTNSFLRAKHDGLLGSLNDASDRGVKVRLLLYVENDDFRQKLQEELKKKFATLSVRYMHKPLERTITTLVRDRQVCLLIKVNDDSKVNSINATVDSTYSNSNATINSCVSKFEFLWIQSELESQKKTKQFYFQLFKEFKLKDESYNRKWLFEAEDDYEKE